jgi:hypothetical protein
MHASGANVGSRSSHHFNKSRIGFNLVEISLEFLDGFEKLGTRLCFCLAFGDDFGIARTVGYQWPFLVACRTIFRIVIDVLRC